MEQSRLWAPVHGVSESDMTEPLTLTHPRINGALGGKEEVGAQGVQRQQRTPGGEADSRWEAARDSRLTLLPARMGGKRQETRSDDKGRQPGQGPREALETARAKAG